MYILANFICWGVAAAVVLIGLIISITGRGNIKLTYFKKLPPFCDQVQGCSPLIYSGKKENDKGNSKA